MRSRRLFLAVDIILCLLFFGLPLTVFRAGDLDIELQQRLYTPDEGWALAGRMPWNLLYHAGPYPALIVGLGAVGILAGGWYKPRWARYRKQALYLVIVMVVGPGLLINGIFKEQWGRPRPRDLVEFSGDERWVPPLSFGTPGEGKSFPCGHCSMGFYFAVFWFLWRRRRPRLAWSALGGSILLGLLIGFARMSQGGHFCSDVLWSGGLTWVTAWGVAAVMNIEARPVFDSAQATGQAKRWWAVVVVITGLVGLGLFLTGTPYHREKVWDAGDIFGSRNADSFAVVRMRVHVDVGDVTVNLGDGAQIRWQASGHGFPGSKVFYDREVTAFGDTLDYRLKMDRRGLFTEFSSEITLVAPAASGLAGTLRMKDGVRFWERSVWTDREPVTNIEQRWIVEVTTNDGTIGYGQE